MPVGNQIKRWRLLVFGCFYRSPTVNDNTEPNNLNMNNLLRSIAEKKYSHYCIVGDFNFPKIDWKTISTSCSETSKENMFIETIRDCFWQQHICESTRRRGQDKASLIDLIFTEEQMQV